MSGEEIARMRDFGFEHSPRSCCFHLILVSLVESIVRPYSNRRRRRLQQAARRAAIAVIVAVVVMIVIGFLVFVLREKGLLPKSRRRERH